MFKVKEKIVTRDIAGIFFLIDTGDKYCYDVKKIYSVNKIGKVLFDIMLEKKNFNDETISSELKGMLNDYNPDLDKKINSDVKKFIEQLVKVGYILEVNHDIR